MLYDFDSVLYLGGALGNAARELSLSLFFLLWLTGYVLYVYRFAASSEVRQLYKQFIAAVVELMGGEMVSEEFREVALNVYWLFCATPEPENGDKKIMSER